MLTIRETVDISNTYDFSPLTDQSRIIFFDIETTGLSANTSYLYLIGCIYYEASSYHLIQWFSEDISEEPLLISSFFKFLKNFNILVHYNGNGFDIPYLIRKCNQYRMDYSFDDIESIDIYRKILPYKKIFRLDNYKQKTVETFLDIHRLDTFSGGELIEVYQSYLGKRHIERLKKIRLNEDISPKATEADQLLKQLLLHNADDLKGLVSISPMISYSEMFETPMEVTRVTLTSETLTIEFNLSSPVPKPLSFGNRVFYYSVYDSMGTLKVRTFSGELKFYYENYKDYYYLPHEDTAIHKSVASFVDERYRIKAKASTCYTRKSGTFIPQYNIIITPPFKQNHQDKITYIEINQDLLDNTKELSLYVSHVINHIVKSKQS